MLHEPQLHETQYIDMQSKCNSYSSDYSLHESVGTGFQVYNLVRTFLKVDPERYIYLL